jgi:hypothetical protein
MTFRLCVARKPCRRIDRILFSPLQLPDGSTRTEYVRDPRIIDAYILQKKRMRINTIDIRDSVLVDQILDDPTEDPQIRNMLAERLVGDFHRVVVSFEGWVSFADDNAWSSRRRPSHSVGKTLRKTKANLDRRMKASGQVPKKVSLELEWEERKIADVDVDVSISCRSFLLLLLLLLSSPATSIGQV